MDTNNSDEENEMSIDDVSYKDYTLKVELSGFDRTTIGTKTLTFTLKGYENSNINSGECSVSTAYNVYHYAKKGEIDTTEFKTDYALNESIDLNNLYVKFTYEDDSTERLSYADVAAMAKFSEQTGVSGFDSTKFGVHQSVRISHPSSEKGTSTSTYYYNVLPDASWTKQTANAGGRVHSFYTTSDMEVGSFVRNSVKFDKVSFGNARLIMVEGTGYIIGTLNSSAIQQLMNKSGQLLNYYIPAGQTAVVTNTTKTSKYYRIEYCTMDSANQIVSKNVMYWIYSSNGNRQLPILIEGVDGLTTAELSTVAQFVELAWFN